MISLPSGKISAILPVLLTFFIINSCGLAYEYPLSDKITEEPSHDIADYVIDGDTLESGGKRIRLIGINTPEEDQYYYQESKLALQLMVEGKEIRLERDITNKDQYGRLLRYVYMDDLFVNMEMVKRGFAHVYTYPPDVAYQDMLLEAERYARENNLGLWAESEYTGIEIYLNYDAPGDDTRNLNGEYAVIKNNSERAIDISGWTIKDSATNIYCFKSYTLKKGEEVQIFSGQGTDYGNHLYWNSEQPIWNNDGDTLYLRDREGKLVEMYSY